MVKNEFITDCKDLLPRYPLEFYNVFNSALDYELEQFLKFQSNDFFLSLGISFNRDWYDEENYVILCNKNLRFRNRFKQEHISVLIKSLLLNNGVYSYEEYVVLFLNIYRDILFKITKKSNFSNLDVRQTYVYNYYVAFEDLGAIVV